MRGYFGIGIIGCKTAENIGCLWRSAHNFGAAFCFVIGARYKRQSSDTTHTSLHVPFFQYDTVDNFVKHGIPCGTRIVAIEQTTTSDPLHTFEHHQRCVYLLGAEDTGVPYSLIETYCHDVVHIDTPWCVNVAVAGSIVMYDRCAKQKRGIPHE